MDFEKTITRLKEMKKEAKTEAVKLNLQHKIDLLLKKKQRYDNN